MRWLIVVALIGCTVVEDEIQITQTTTNEISAGFRCRVASMGGSLPINTGLDVSYYRAFSMPRGGFQLDLVSFGIAATAASPRPAFSEEPVEVIVWAYNGPLGQDTLDLNDRVQVTTVKPAPWVAGTDNMIVDVPIPLVVTSYGLLVEIHVATSTVGGKWIEIGANSEGETVQGFVKSFNCSDNALQTSQVYSNTATEYALVIYLTGSIIPDVGDQPPIR